MYTGLLHTHRLVVILFLIIYLIKTILLLTNNFSKLEKFTKIIKVPDMIVSFLFLATGAALMVLLPEIRPLLWYKLAAVALAIPLAVIGFMKKNKVLATLSFVCLLGAYGLAEMNGKAVKTEVSSEVITDPAAAGYDSVVHGKALFKANCSQCHGMDGKLMLAGAKDLSISAIDRQEATATIKNGKNSMPKYEGVLSADEIEALVDYVMPLREKE